MQFISRLWFPLPGLCGRFGCLLSAPARHTSYLRHRAGGTASGHSATSGSSIPKAVWLAFLSLAVFAALPAVASPRPVPLRFEPYAFETERSGTIPAEVAYLEVPRRHDEPDGERMRLRVVRIRASNGADVGPPVVYLAGGPGGSGVGTARGPRWQVFERVRRERDLLLLDQRGTGLSEPPPSCPHIHRFPEGSVLQREAALAALRATAERCMAAWRKDGVDLGAYTTVESAHDIESLRSALGVPRISLWGMSYGTHLALAAARLHGAGIDRMVLLGTEGPDDTLKLPLTADALLEKLDLLARQRGFDLAGSARRVLAGLRVHPRQGRSLMRGGRRVTISEFDAQLAIAAALGRRSTQQLLPLMLRDADNGDFDLMADIVLAVRGELGTFKAMPLAMDVASGHTSQRRKLVDRQARASLFGDALNFPFPMLADGMGLADLGDAFRSPLQTDIPTLFVGGTLDGRTALTNVEALLPGFSSGQTLVVRGASHDDELWLGHPGIAASIADFLAGREVKDAELDVPPPRFVKNKLALLFSTLGVTKGALLGLAAVAALPGIVIAMHGHRRRR